MEHIFFKVGVQKPAIKQKELVWAIFKRLYLHEVTIQYSCKKYHQPLILKSEINIPKLRNNLELVQH